MKKKIILLAVALMLFAGVVSASSINGDYQGMPIVKITSGDRVLETDEVPGFIYEGHTVVPISTLRQLGASVTWDAYGYSVDVKLPIPQPSTPSPANTSVDLEKVILGFNKTAKEYNASDVRMVFNNLGGYMDASITATGNTNIDMQNIMLTSSFVANSPVSQMFINIYHNNTLTGYYAINRASVESSIKQELAADDFIKSWQWYPATDAAPPVNTPEPASDDGSYTLNDALAELGVTGGMMPTVDMKSLAIELLKVRQTKKQSDYSVRDALIELGIPNGARPTLATLKQAIELIKLK